MYENRDKWRGEYWLQLHKFREREGGPGVPVTTPTSPPLFASPSFKQTTYSIRVAKTV